MSFDPAVLLEQPLAGGVHHSDTPPENAVEALRRAGWHAARIGPVDTPAAFYAAVGVALHFPPHFGQNLDALWDCLTELDQPTALVWVGWQRLSEDPTWWPEIVGLLEERADEDPPFAVLFC